MVKFWDEGLSSYAIEADVQEEIWRLQDDGVTPEDALERIGLASPRDFVGWPTVTRSYERKLIRMRLSGLPRPKAT